MHDLVDKPAGETGPTLRSGVCVKWPSKAYASVNAGTMSYLRVLYVAIHES
jgi:hypothetical protein